jgi:hypothetical protein
MQGLLSYNLSVTGDCSNTNIGAFNVVPSGFGPYTINWVNPSLGTDTNVTESLRTGLGYGTYEITITDSNPSGAGTIGANLFMTSGFCISTTSTDTSCSQSNGTLSIDINQQINTDFYLYSLIYFIFFCFCYAFIVLLVSFFFSFFFFFFFFFLFLFISFSFSFFENWFKQ